MNRMVGFAVAGLIVYALVGLAMTMTGFNETLVLMWAIWGLIGCLVIGAFVGVIVELNYRVKVERKKYEKLYKFLRLFVTPEDWQGMVERLLQNKAGLCAGSNQRVVDFQQMKLTVSGIAHLKHLYGEYLGEQEVFKSLQRAFYGCYDLAKPYMVMLGFTLRERKLEAYTTSAVVLQSEQPCSTETAEE